MQRFGVKLYGLLVLDSDGRRVGSINLRDIYKRPGLAARRLEALATAPALETHRVTVAGPAKNLAALRDAAQAERSVRAAVLDGGTLTITGTLSPKTLARHAAIHGVSLTYRTPVPLKVSATQSPGIWYVEDGVSYVTSLFVHPKRLGIGGDRVKTRTMTVPGARGGSVAKHVLLGMLSVPGVINVLPNLRAERIDVVGLDDRDTWAAVRSVLALTVPK